MNSLSGISASDTVEILVESVLPLTEDELKELTAVFTSKFSHVNINNTLNPLLLGGLKITFNGQVIDLSLTAKLQSVQKSLLTYAKK